MKTLLVLTTALVAGATFAAGPKENPRRSYGPRPGMMEGASDPIVRLVRNPEVARSIGLTEEQQKKIAEINKTSREPELNKQLRESMKRQAELLKAEKIDEAAVMAEIDKAYDIRKEVAKRQTKRVIEIKSILTPEQVQKALEVFKNRPRRGMAKQGAPAAKDAKEKAAPKPEAEKPAPAQN